MSETNDSKYSNLTAQKILNIAVEEMRDRAKKRDSEEGERSMEKTVKMFNLLKGKDLSEEDGWLFMVCLKLVRGSQGSYHPDDYVDAAAYSALQGEAAYKQDQLNRINQATQPAAPIKLSQAIVQGGLIKV